MNVTTHAPKIVSIVRRVSPSAFEQAYRSAKTEVERADCSLDDVNQAIDSVLDGSAGTARTVLRIGTPVALREGAHALASV